MDTKKILSIAFCGIMCVILAALIAVRAHTGGQMKTVTKLCSAIVRNNYSDYRSCFGEEAPGEFTFGVIYSEYARQFGEGFHMKADFLSREEYGAGYNVAAKITVYNDLDSETTLTSFFMVKRGGKWIIID